MKKIFGLIILFSFLGFQACEEDEVILDPPTVTPPAPTSVQINKAVDVTFTVLTPAGYKSSAITATGGAAVAKSEPAAGALEGSVVVTFTAGANAGAGSVVLNVTDNKDKSNSQTAVLSITLDAPPTIALSATTGSGVPGSTVKVTATVTAPNGFASIAVAGATSVPASPIAITAATKEVEISIPATAVVGSIISAVFTTTDAKGLVSSGVTLVITVTDATIALTGTLAADYTIEKGKAYLVKSQYIVPTGKTLTVNKGAIVKGDKATKGVIIIQPGGKLVAVGEAAEPIVFTSSQPVGERDRGDWGGIVWLGDAYVNQSAKPSVEGISPSQSYGTVSQSDATVGNNTQDNGKLKYVRIEYAGIELTPNNETNSLTMGGLGSTTEIDYVQVSYGGDDGFEWFGGTVNAKHLVSLSTWDDDFDTDFGWRGNVQWGVVVRNPFFADQSGSTAFESDSQANGNAIGTVCDDTNKGGCTKGVFSNITVLGPRDYTRSISANYTRAMHIRRRTAISIFNSVVTGFPTGLTIDDAGTLTNYKADNTGEGRLNNNVLINPLLPTVPSTIGTNTTPVTSIAPASGNANYGSTDASNIWLGATSGNTTSTAYFVSRFVKNADGVVTGQAISSVWASSASTIAAADVAFATVPGWTAGTAVDVINPYTGTGIQNGAFFAGSTSASYPSNPSFAVTTGTITGKSAAVLFADAAKLPSSFFKTDLTYIGGFGDSDWTDSWSEFQPLNKAY